MAREANLYADANWALWPTGNRWKEVRDERFAELVRADERAIAAQPAPVVQEPVAMAKRRVFDAIRGAYDLGYNDARGARAVHGDSAPGYKGRDVEADHGGALFSALERYTTPPAAQPAVPDAFGTREGEHPQYVQGWNDCRAEMLKGRHEPV
jgi:hypothetical protein